MSMYSLIAAPQEITLGETSVATTNALGVTHILLRTTTDIFIAMGAAPTATVDGNACHFVGEGEVLPLQVNPGDKLAAIPVFSYGVGGKVRISPLG